MKGRNQVLCKLCKSLTIFFPQLWDRGVCAVKNNRETWQLWGRAQQKQYGAPWPGCPGVRVPLSSTHCLPLTAQRCIPTTFRFFFFCSPNIQLILYFLFFPIFLCFFAKCQIFADSFDSLSKRARNFSWRVLEVLKKRSRRRNSSLGSTLAHT